MQSTTSYWLQESKILTKNTTTSVATSVASIKTSKIESLNKLSAATDKLAATMADRRRHESWIKLAMFYQAAGDMNQAAEYITKVKEDTNRIEKRNYQR